VLQEQKEEKNILSNKLEQTVKIGEKEQNFSRKIDDAFAEQGYKTKDMWPQCTIALTMILLIMTCLVCFYKPDFVNLTVCIVAIYILDRSTASSE
jgi:uncharacterized membrane protein